MNAMAKKKQNAKRSQPPIAQNATSEATQKPSSGMLPPIHADDPYSRAVTVAVWEAIHAGYRGEFLDRFKLLSDGQALIQFCMGSLNKEEYDLIYLFAGLNIQMTTFLDNIVQYSDGEGFRRLRALARDRAYWPTMMRPGDPKFSETRIKKLEVGKNSIVRQAEGRLVSLATPRNRLAVELVDQLCFLAQVIFGHAKPRAGVQMGDDTVNQFGLQKIEQLINPKVIEKYVRHKCAYLGGTSELAHRLKLEITQRQQKLLDLLTEIRRDSSPLSKNTVSQWSRWISDYVLLTDPELTHPELQKLRSGKKPSLSELGKFFHPALENLSRSAAD
jgi:hypothetical protein